MHRDDSPSTTVIVNGDKSGEHTKLRKPFDKELLHVMVLTKDLYFADTEGLQTQQCEGCTTYASSGTLNTPALLVHSLERQSLIKKDMYLHTNKPPVQAWLAQN